VDRKADKDITALMANGVSGVFSVTNNLRIACIGRHRARLAA
jgi:hypothetical protein